MVGLREPTSGEARALIGWISAADEAEVTRLCVDPTYQRRGWATLLMCWLSDHLRAKRRAAALS